jgi:hypothetical protein
MKVYNPMEDQPTEYIKRGGVKFAQVTHPLSKACQEYEMKPHKWLIGGESGWQADVITVTLTDFRYGYTDADKKAYFGAGVQRPFYADYKDAIKNHDDVADFVQFEGLVHSDEGGEEGPNGAKGDYVKFDFMASKAYPFQTVNKHRIDAYKAADLAQGAWPITWDIGLELVEARGSKFAKPKFALVSEADPAVFEFALGLKDKYSKS